MSDYKAMLVGVREEEIEELSMMATYIVESFIQSFYGRKQKEYMLEQFQSMEAIASEIERGDKYYWVDSIPADEEESVLGMLDMCGYMSCAFEGDDLVIRNLYLMEETRGRHIIRECMELLAKAEDLPENINRIVIRIPEGFVQAVRVFEHIGFENNGKIEMPIGKNYKLNCVEFYRSIS